jgi:hypothetical protein
MNNYKNILLINSNNYNDFLDYDNIIIIINNNSEINTNKNKKIIISENFNSEINKFNFNNYFDYIEISSENYKDLYIFILSIRRFCNENTIIKINSNLIKNINNTFFDKLSYIDNNSFKFYSEYINNFINTKYPTIITAMYYIRKDENNQLYNERPIEKYIEWGKSYLLLDFPIIIYTDEYLFPILSEIFYIKNNIKIIKKNLKITYFYKHIDLLTKLQNNFIISNKSIEKDTPLYVIINNNKFDFLEDAIENNYFDTDKFMWIDFGISKFAKNFEYINMWIKDLPNEIRPNVNNTKY